MEQAKLIFSRNGKAVHIEFANGRESFDFENKEDLIYGINDCHTRNKITSGDLKRFLQEISSATEKGILFPSQPFAGIYFSPAGFHRHKCKKCGYVWEHHESCYGQINLHECPNCKTKERFKYFGTEPHPTNV